MYYILYRSYYFFKIENIFKLTWKNNFDIWSLRLYLVLKKFEEKCKKKKDKIKEKKVKGK